MNNKLFIENVIDTTNNSNFRYKIKKGSVLTKNAMNVLESAFSDIYDNDFHYANMYDLANGSKGMDWWNFPWDLTSSLPKYQITFNDMKNILENVIVKMEIKDTHYVRYSSKLSSNMTKLTSGIMNSHGGFLRVIKIIYCARNFMSVALKYNLIEDINNLKKGIKHILSINKDDLSTDPNPFKLTYGKKSKHKPKNIDGILEDRTRNNGLKELKNIIKII